MNKKAEAITTVILLLASAIILATFYEQEIRIQGATSAENTRTIVFIQSGAGAPQLKKITVDTITGSRTTETIPGPTGISRPVYTLLVSQGDWIYATGSESDATGMITNPQFLYARNLKTGEQDLFTTNTFTFDYALTVTKNGTQTIIAAAIRQNNLPGIAIFTKSSPLTLSCTSPPLTLTPSQPVGIVPFVTSGLISFYSATVTYTFTGSETLASPMLHRINTNCATTAQRDLVPITGNTNIHSITSANNLIVLLTSRDLVTSSPDLNTITPILSVNLGIAIASPSQDSQSFFATRFDSANNENLIIDYLQFFPSTVTRLSETLTGVGFTLGEPTAFNPSNPTISQATFKPGTVNTVKHITKQGSQPASIFQLFDSVTEGTSPHSFIDMFFDILAGVCGDSVVLSPETCDPPGTISPNCPTNQLKKCKSNCQCGDSCGDGLFDPTAGEECDGTVGCPDITKYCDSGAGKTCACKPKCGNSIVNPEAGEECDKGPQNAGTGECNTQCKKTRCGDFTIQKPNGFGLTEECEVSTDCASGKICNQCLCKLPPSCGDGKIDPGEVCDPPGQQGGCLTGKCRPGCNTCSRCGDGITDADLGEQCDDGAQNNINGKCDPTCQPTKCGDGIIQAPNGAGQIEQCDPPPNFLGALNICNNCVKTKCGDNIRQSPNSNFQFEECDGTDSTACLGLCTASLGPFAGCQCSTPCGNNQIDGSEQCDGTADQACPGKCIPKGQLGQCKCKNETCGNNLREGFEMCDGTDDKFCPGKCTSSCACTGLICGNGKVEGREQCDDGNVKNNDGCDQNCKVESCGNNILQSPEQCDDGNNIDGDNCDKKCNKEECGNAIVQSGEGCDDGNKVNGDGCSANCKLERCGNNVLDIREQCDDGNTANNDGCDENCRKEICGNGFLQTTEQCDDGNTAEGDGCDKNCRREACGNGIIQTNEDCEDGNIVDGDGCDKNCKREICGNGKIQINEQCDDGNTANGDGCDQNCKKEICGNGVLQGNEECDDGKTNDCDGCSAQCKKETDTDNDGKLGKCDNCPNIANQDQKDEDNDGTGDLCDNCPKKSNSDQKDYDQDGLGNVCDNCIEVQNPDQADTSNDGIGDACDCKAFDVKFGGKTIVGKDLPLQKLSGKHEIRITDKDEKTTVKFTREFTADCPDFSKSILEPLLIPGQASRIITKEIPLPIGTTKTVTFPAGLGSNLLCIIDTPTVDATELETCKGGVKLQCPGSVAHPNPEAVSPITCNKAGSNYEISGLFHTAIQELPKPPPTPIIVEPTPPGGGVFPPGTTNAECKDECALQRHECLGTDGYKICGQYDNDACLEWSSPQKCLTGHVCTNGQCAKPGKEPVKSCQDDCTPGQQCIGTAGYQICQTGNDGCLHYGSFTPCPPEMECQSRECIQTQISRCTDECVPNTKKCVGGNIYVSCQRNSNNPCYAWTPNSLSCEENQVCENGKCVTSKEPKTPITEAPTELTPEPEIIVTEFIPPTEELKLQRIYTLGSILLSLIIIALIAWFVRKRRT